MKGKKEKSEHSTIRCFVALTRSQQRFETLVDAILGNNIHLGILCTCIYVALFYVFEHFRSFATKFKLFFLHSYFFMLYKSMSRYRY